MQIVVRVTSEKESEEGICKNCDQKLESHEEKRTCLGNSNSNYSSWCIANRKKYWE